MAFRPARTCWTAWLPVSAPRAWTYGSEWSSDQRRWAPFFASVYSICTEPRRRSTSALEYGRWMPSKRAAWARSSLWDSVLVAAVDMALCVLLFSRIRGEQIVGGDR